MAADSRKPVFFFDIDNCLYSRRPTSEEPRTLCRDFPEPLNEVLENICVKGGFKTSKCAKVHHMMGDLIDKYFQTHLSLSQQDANELHMRYYKDYGLAIEGLVRYHKVDPLEYNAKVDDALPLEDVIKQNPKLRKLLEDFDRSKIRLWLFTNAYINHANRVIKLLGLEGIFEGVTYCDYAAEKLLCKPHKDMFAKAMREARVERNEDCYFVDDSGLNVKGAHELGWTAVHLVEPSEPEPPQLAGKYQVRDLEELRQLFPQFFKEAGS